MFSHIYFFGIYLLFLFFFFSSRRRHTRYWRDWIQTCALPISAAVRAALTGSRTLLLAARPPAVAGLRDVDGLAVVTVEGGAALEGFWARHVESLAAVVQIGRASCRERGEISVVAVSLKKKKMK